MRKLLERYGLAAALILASVAILFGAWDLTSLQSERNRAILTECQQQNVRHDATIKQLDREVAYYRKHPPPGQTRAAFQHSVQGTIALIDALAPEQNCQVVLRSLSKP